MNPQLTNPRADEIDAILKRLPFAQTLGMRCEVLGDEMTAILPFQEKLIGNVAIRALHGGAIASFLELTAMLQVFLVSDMPRPPKPINLTIDYLRQGHANPLQDREGADHPGAHGADATRAARRARVPAAGRSHLPWNPSCARCTTRSP